MSKLASCLMAALMVAGTVSAAQAQARGGPPGPGGSRRGLPCGAPLSGEAPDVMTYDRASGTQVFVGGQGQTEVTAFNHDTGSSAAISGDLSRPGVAEACAVDNLSRDSYRVSSAGPGDMSVSGRVAGERFAFKRADGSTEYWDPRGDNHCFKSGLGIFTPTGNLGLAVATPPGAVGVGVAAGDRFGGVGVGANRNFAGVGVVGC